MSQAQPTADALPSVQPTSQRWLYSPSLDLLFGAGGFYLLSLVPLLWFSMDRGIGAWSMTFVALFTLGINTPHYGATILRVYDRSEDRHRYAFFAIGITALIGLAFVTSLHFFWLGSLLVTTYVTWTPWHFAGQNYGVALTFLRRAGTPTPPLAKRLFYSSFLISAALAILSIHVADADAVYSAGISGLGETYRVLRLGIPISVAKILLPALLILYLVTSVASLVLLARGGHARSVIPAGMLILTQAGWFSLPAIVRLMYGPSDLNIVFAVIWVSTCHSLQYLWITSYYARRSETPMRSSTFLWKAMLAGSLVNVLPGLAFAPALLGRVSWEAGLAMLVFSVVNIHHFMLDGVVWKLRDGAVARALLRLEPPPTLDGPLSSRARSLGRTGIYAIGALSVLVPVVMAWELIVGFPRASGDLARLETSARNLRWVGRDNPNVLSSLGDEQLRSGQVDAALASYRRSNEVLPDRIRMNNLAWALATRDYDDPRSLREALALAELASATAKGQDPVVLDTLAVIYAAQERYDKAIDTGRRAARLALAQGQPRMAQEISQRVALYRARKPYRP